MEVKARNTFCLQIWQMLFSICRRVCCVMVWGSCSWEAEDGWESLCREKGLTLPVLASPALGSGCGFGGAASGPLGLKCEGRGEREVKKENILKPVSPRLRYYSHSWLWIDFLPIPHLFHSRRLHCCQLEFQAWCADTGEASGSWSCILFFFKCC